jgi:trimethylamine:corrinoid methyltransferase-like protein
MATALRVLADAEIARIHEESLAVLARTGMRVDSAGATAPARG